MKFSRNQIIGSLIVFALLFAIALGRMFYR